MLQVMQVTKEINLSTIICCRVVSMECGTVVTENVSVNTAPAKLLSKKSLEFCEFCALSAWLSKFIK